MSITQRFRAVALATVVGSSIWLGACSDATAPGIQPEISNLQDDFADLFARETIRDRDVGQRESGHCGQLWLGHSRDPRRWRHPGLLPVIGRQRDVRNGRGADRRLDRADHLLRCGRSRGELQGSEALS